MGWTVIPGATKEDVVRELLNDYNPVDHELCGDILWAVVAGDGLHPNLVVCFLLRAPNGGWGYKPLEERMHPAYYSCPLRLLDQAPVTCQDWRETVRKYHRHRSTRE